MPTPVESRARIRAEVWIVLGLTLGQSAVFALWRIVERYQREAPVGQQTVTLNNSASAVELMDAIYQVLVLAFRMAPVLLVLYLLSAAGRSWRERLGLVGGARAWWRDAAHAAGLAALVGLPGLAVYAFGRAIGQTVRIDTSGLPDHWWAATVLLVGAATIGILEETIAVGYLVSRLRDLAWGPVAIVLASATLRAGYHLYQGWPMALGNAAMGALFAVYFLRTGRLGPLILAHFTLDAVAFIGPELAPESWLEALRVA